MYYQDMLKPFAQDTAPYESTGIPFWDDPHIAQSMLAAHLSPDSDGASRRHDFIRQSVDWIASLQPPDGKSLLDLGCGPGVYAEMFDDKGYRMTGIDFSQNSIAYARQSAEEKGKGICYHYQDYLAMEYENAFDIAVLIYCDFGVLPPGDRARLLRKVYQALKPGGIFIIDTFTQNQYTSFHDALEAAYEPAGFWRAEPYLCLKRKKVYPEALYLEQYTIISQGDCQTYNLWNHAFSKEELATDLKRAGFGVIDFYGDVTGVAYTDVSETLCAVGRKE